MVTIPPTAIDYRRCFDADATDGPDLHAMTDAEYEAYVNSPENVDAWWDTTAALQEAMDPDAGRDIGEPDTDPRDFRAWLRDYVSDARTATVTAPDNEPLTATYCAGLHDAALEILARYEQETDTDGRF